MNRWISVVLIVFAGGAGFWPVCAQSERAATPEERAKQYVAELERIRRSREAAAKADKEARLAAAREEERARPCQIRCEIRFRSSGGEVRSGAGEVVLLLTSTDASRAAVNAAVRDDTLRSLRGLPEVLLQTKSDEQGMVRIDSLPAGSYLLVSEVRWIKEGFFRKTQQGGVVFCALNLSPGSSVEVLASN